MTQTPPDAPRVIVFPPIVPIGTIILSCLLQWLYPIGIIGLLALSARASSGSLLLAFGIAMMVRGGLALTLGGTNVHPSQPALALVESGIYAWTRNPMYVGGIFAMVGVALVFAIDWLPLLLAPASAVLHFGIVAPEETYLAHKFGDRYRRYKARVPRYIWPF